MMKKAGILIIFLKLCACTSFAQTGFTFNINTTQNRKPISPYIYGTNDVYLNAGAKRLGGNRLTGYNWENNASNAGGDFGHQNDHYVPWTLGVPAAQYNTPGSAITHFHNQSLAQGAYSLVTLPMAGYVAADAKETEVTQAQRAPSSRWRSVVVRKPSALSLTPDLTDGSVYVDEEVNFLINKFGASNTATGIKGYSLDNEPAGWPGIHPRLFGTNALRVNTLMQRSFLLAQRIKELDPNAEVFGPAAYGFNEYLNLQDAPDWNAVRGTHTMFLTYYLAEMRRQSNSVGRRLLDVLDLHWYPENDLDTDINPFDDQIDDPEINKERMNRPRSLWDPTYVENTWIGQFYRNTIMPVIPTVKGFINQHYPGTKLGFSEYSYMGIRHISGGIAQADALGIFGQQGVYFATYWGGVTHYIKAGFDIYRNYDGKGSRFGDMAVEAATNDREFSSVYAAENSLDNSKLHVVAINKDQNNARVATIVVNSPITYKSARVWMFDSTDITIKRVDNIKVINGNTFQFTLPPQSVYHFVLTTEDLSLHPFTESAVIAPAAGYSDGTSSFTITAKITDGDNNITGVTVDLSPVGGSATQAMARSGNIYTCTYTVPAGTATGIKYFLMKAVDANNHVGEHTLTYRVIKRLAAEKIWDGDVLEAGTFEPPLSDPDDSKQGLMLFERRFTGGNEEPGSMYFHMEHDPNKWNMYAFRFDVDDNSADVYRNVSDYEFLEFYIKSNAPAASDIGLSIGDYGLEGTDEIGLKKNGYISSFNPNGYTRVRVPFKDLVKDKAIDLSQFWQMNFHSNTAEKGFDVWIDDIRAIPFSHPAYRPQISDSTVTPVKNFADGFNSITVQAVVTDPDNDLQSVTIDLSPLNGPNNAVMTRFNGRYTITYILPADIAKGKKLLTITASDAGNNSTQASLPFLVYQKAVSDTVWNGDSKPMGEAIFLSNDATTVTVEPNGGNYRPGVLHIHMEETNNNGEQYSQIVWDWNEGSDNENIQDATQKRYIQFLVKVQGSASQPNFDFEFLLRDPFGRFSKAVNIRDYLASFTGGYQQVRIPLATLLDGTRVDRSQLTGFSINAPDVNPANGIEVYIDDITLLGSTAADVQISSQDANCSSNGRINVDNVIDGPGGYTYSINGSLNPAGSQNTLFQGLVPGTYSIKVNGASDFVYVSDVTIRGYTGINAATTSTNTSATVSASGGSGSYGYLWSTGATTNVLTNVPMGAYSVTVTDRVSGCTATTRAVVGTPLSSNQIYFSVEKAPLGTMIHFRGEGPLHVKHYEVLYSIDGSNFQVVAQVMADGEKEQEKALYHFNHLGPVKGVNYYKLKMVLQDGRFMLSTVKSIRYNNDGNTILAIPNPFIQTVDLKTNRKVISIEVADVVGRVVNDVHYTLGNEGARLNLGKQAPGVYVITMQFEDGWEKVKVLKL